MPAQKELSLPVNVIDRAWAIVRKDNEGMIYGLGTSPQEAWARACELMCSEKSFLGKRGYRALKVAIVKEG